ncbi:hypothetical protein STEG23_023661, partial [Scotinomys teguina]
YPQLDPLHSQGSRLDPPSLGYKIQVGIREGPRAYLNSMSTPSRIPLFLLNEERSGRDTWPCLSVSQRRGKAQE